jgi:hypothetical protein
MTTTDTPDRPNGPDRPWQGPLARLPMPGNAELLIYVLAAILVALVIWIDDATGAGLWVDFFKWATAAYLICRGIAKASRVYEY